MESLQAMLSFVFKAPISKLKIRNKKVESSSKQGKFGTEQTKNLIFIFQTLNFKL